jgi:hypothetical protein
MRNPEIKRPLVKLGLRLVDTVEPWRDMIKFVGLIHPA